jgi:hypothetical protein
MLKFSKNILPRALGSGESANSIRISPSASKEF